MAALTTFLISSLSAASVAFILNVDRLIAVFAGAIFLLASWAAIVFYKRRKERGNLPGPLPAHKTGSDKSDTDDGSNAAAQSTDKNSNPIPLKKRMNDAVRTVRGSRLGELRGHAALYELPWLMIIGQPSSGKSSAIHQGGLRFPLSDQRKDHGLATKPTRDCEWLFTADGVLLDTAGDYCNSQTKNAEWLALLSLLRKGRPRAPINGLVVTVSLASLIGTSSQDVTDDAVERHATALRQRIHEVTEYLHVTVPVYVMFTMADVIGGFAEFFASLDAGERARVWGATLPLSADGSSSPADRFGMEFDTLALGLRAHANERMTSVPNDLSRALLTMPIEFASFRQVLQRFITTLFEENPFQFRPVFRGFYFTSAMQAGTTLSPLMARTATRFALRSSSGETPSASGRPEGHQVKARHAVSEGHFLTEFFRQVIFADRALVRQTHTRRSRRRLVATAAAACLGTGAILAIFANAYRQNVQFIQNVQADLLEVKRLQADRIDLKSRLDAMLVLQDRLQQLLSYQDSQPLSFRPLYSGDVLVETVRREYFAGMRQLMVEPVSIQMESFLTQVVSGSSATPAGNGVAERPAGQAGSPYRDSSATDKSEAYDVLKAYLMLTDAKRAEKAHLASQLTRFWRQWLEQHRGSMSREELVDRAEKLLSMHVSLAAAPGWPAIQPKAALVDDTRRLLSEAMKGTPARDRVFAEIIARGSARYPGTTVRDIVGAAAGTTLTGSYAIPGAYSAAAWHGYVKQAIGDASRKALDTSDWVLQDSHVDDLTLSGSPEHVSKDLQQMYASHYINEWQRFLAGIGVTELLDFPHALAAMEQLGDAEQSPLRKLLERARAETSWDAGSSTGVVKDKNARFDVVGLADRSPPVAVPATAGVTDGPVTREFAGLARMVDARDGAEPPLRAYLGALGRLRVRLRGISNEGEVGPGARRLVEATLQGKASELVDALRITDEHILIGLTDLQRQALRPLLLRPLMQTFAALVPHVENELNRVWAAQVNQPFTADLTRKFPFDEQGRVEASAMEIAAIFGPTGAVARFANESLAPLVERRGDILTPRQWGDHGITLSPTLLADFPQWVAPLGTTVAGPQTLFQLLPEPTPGGVSEYTVNIAGQSLRYRNEPAQWSNFTWGGTSSVPMVSIEATTADGQIIHIADFQGGDALGDLVRSAERRRTDDGTHVLAWSRDGITVGMRLKIVSTSEVDADGAQKRGLRGTQLPSFIAGKTELIATVAEGAPR
jgi:type VI secretion system protein ImpL